MPTRLLSSRIKKNVGPSLASERYEFLSLENAEPDFGFPDANDSLIGSNSDGTRRFFTTGSGLNIDVDGLITGDETTFAISPQTYKYTNSTTLRDVLSDIDTNATDSNTGDTFVFRNGNGDFSGNLVTVEELLTNGTIRGPAVLKIDPAPYIGNIDLEDPNDGLVEIYGSLSVLGESLTINSLIVNISDLELENNLIASQIESNISTGSAPFIVASTTKVDNLNADSLDGLDESDFLRSNVDDNYTAGVLTFDNGATVAFANTTGTAPFTVASTTVVTNLNADTLDGIDSSSFLRSDVSDNYTAGTLSFADGATVSFNAAVGTAPFTVASTTVVTNLNADTLDGLDESDLLRSNVNDNYSAGTLTFDSGTTLDAADGATVSFSNAIGAAPFTVASTTVVTNLNADSLDGLDESDFLRSNVDDSYTTGTLSFANGATVNFNNAVGVAPFAVVSTTVVANLNADSLDGLDESDFLRSNVSDNYTSGTLTFDSGAELTAAAGSVVNFNNTAGTAPFTVISTDVVTNLNADLLDGLDSTAFLRSDASIEYTSGTLTLESGTTLDADAGSTVNFNNAIGTAPFTVISTTKVDNLNADLLDGLDESDFVRSNVNDNYTAGTLTFDSGSGLTASNGSTVTFNNATNVAPFIVASTTKVDNLNADQLDGLDESDFLRSNVTDNYTSGTFTFDSGTVLAADAGSTVNFNNAIGTAPFTVISTTKVDNLNADLLDGLDESAFLRSDTSDNYTSGTLTFDSGAILTAAAGATVNFNNAIGTAPFTVISTDAVANLNVDRLDDLHAVDFTLDYVTTNGSTTTNAISVGNIETSGYIRGPATLVIDPAVHLDDTGLVEIAGSLEVNSQLTVDGNITANAEVSVATNMTIGGVLQIDGDLIVSGSTFSVSSTNLSVSNNFIFLNQPVTYTIIAITTTGTAVTYQTSEDHSFIAGSVVSVDGVDPISFNGDSFSIDSVTADTFTILSTNVDTYVSGGSAQGKENSNPDVGFLAEYDDGNGLENAGLFRDGTDFGIWKLFQDYTPDPSASVNLDTTHPSFSLADLSVKDLIAIGSIKGPATFTIDPAVVGDDTGTVIIAGALTVNTSLDVSTSITGETLVSDVADGTAPLTVTSTTVVTNLNADTVDGIQGASLLRSDTSDNYTSGTFTFDSGTTLEAAAGATVNFNNAIGTAPFTVISTDVVTNLNADTVDGINGAAILRSDESDNYTSGTLTFDSGTTLDAADGAIVSFSSTTGTAPFTVASTTVVTNLNADTLDGLDESSFLRSDASDSYTSGTLSFTTGTTVDIDDGCALNFKNLTTTPFTVLSTTKVDNLNADQLDGLDESDFLRSNVTDNYTSGTFTFDSGTTLEAAAGATVNFNNAIGTAPFTVISTTKVDNLNVDSLDGLDSTAFLRSDETDSYTTGTLTFNSGTSLDLSALGVSGTFRLPEISTSNARLDYAYISLNGDVESNTGIAILRDHLTDSVTALDISSDLATKTITTTGNADFSIFTVGRTITISGSVGIDGTYTVASVNATEIVVNEAIADEIAGNSITISEVIDESEVSINWNETYSITSPARAWQLLGLNDTSSSNLTDIVTFYNAKELAATTTEISATWNSVNEEFTFDLLETGVVAAEYGSATEIPVFTVDNKGRISSVSTSSITTTLTVEARGTGGIDQSISLDTDKLKFDGVANQIETSTGATDLKTVTIGLADDLSIVANVSTPKVTIDNLIVLDSDTYNSTTLNSEVITEFVAAEYSSAKFVIQAKDALGEVQISEILIAHNGTTATLTEFGIVHTSLNPITEYTVDIVPVLTVDTVQISATAASTNMDYTVLETLIV